ncbi:gamma-glutamylcyclotransferase [Candidatus Poribacteria bacterium]|nr:gamma-glutamylcyclotransferase [Candidatus Poribacteria bacterium]
MRYFAYGSNMNIAQMRERCPGITHIGRYQLDGFRLVFNYHADIVPAEGCTVHGALWSITPGYEAALDRYEGYPSYYGKYYDQNDVMFYRMQGASGNLKPPALWYLTDVIQGYKDFQLTQADFEESLGVQQLGLTQAVEQILGVPMDELERLFS